MVSIPAPRVSVSGDAHWRGSQQPRFAQSDVRRSRRMTRNTQHPRCPLPRCPLSGACLVCKAVTATGPPAARPAGIWSSSCDRPVKRRLQGGTVTRPARRRRRRCRRRARPGRLPVRCAARGTVAPGQGRDVPSGPAGIVGQADPGGGLGLLDRDLDPPVCGSHGPVAADDLLEEPLGGDQRERARGVTQGRFSGPASSRRKLWLIAVAATP